MSELVVATACSVDLAPFARANNYVVEVDPAICEATLARMPGSAESKGSVLVRAVLVQRYGDWVEDGSIVWEEDRSPGVISDYQVDIGVGSVVRGRTWLSRIKYVPRDDKDIRETVAHEFRHLIDMTNGSMDGVEEPDSPFFGPDVSEEEVEHYETNNLFEQRAREAADQVDEYLPPDSLSPVRLVLRK